MSKSFIWVNDADFAICTGGLCVHEGGCEKDGVHHEGVSLREHFLMSCMGTNRTQYTRNHNDCHCPRVLYRWASRYRARLHMRCNAFSLVEADVITWVIVSDGAFQD